MRSVASLGNASKQTGLSAIAGAARIRNSLCTYVLAQRAKFKLFPNDLASSRFWT
jgi:hypothetical protein